MEYLDSWVFNITEALEHKATHRLLDAHRSVSHPRVLSGRCIADWARFPPSQLPSSIHPFWPFERPQIRCLHRHWQTAT